MELLERDGELALLTAALEDAAAGSGRVVVVRGEAGIGKTSLVRRFVDDHRAEASVLWGNCDDLSTARPLGPFQDMSDGAAGLGAALAESEHVPVFDALLAILEQPLRPTVMVVEDVHWADTATMDVLRFVGRRIASTHGLLVLTCRTFDSEDEAVTRTMASMPADASLRLDLAALTPQAVAELAHVAGRSAPDLHEDTGGNPFLVTEMLASEDGSLPATVRDSVLARASLIGPEARRTVELVSVVPTRTERRLLEKIVGPSLEELSEAERHGLLVVTEKHVAFRHEVARRAMEASLLGSHRQVLNRLVMEALALTEAAPARLVHHALAAGDTAALVRYAPRAARQAAVVASHREAVENYRLLDGLLDDVDTEDRARILADWAWEEWTVGEPEAAERRALEGARLWRELAEPAGVSQAMRTVAQARWGLADMTGAEEASREAVEVLDPAVPTAELAAAYAIQSWLAMLRHDRDETVAKADLAIDVARRVGDRRIEAHALNNRGVAISDADFPDGIESIEESFAISRANGLDQDAIRAAANLSETYREQRDLGECERWLMEAARLTEQSASGRFELHVTGRRADLHLLRCEWDEAERLADAALATGQFVAPDRPTPLTVLGILAARRGGRDPVPLLQEAADLSRRLDSLERLAPAVAGLAEAAYLRGDIESIPPLVADAYQQALSYRYAWTVGELAYWLWIGGALDGPQEPCAEPYRLQIIGEWDEAAVIWKELGLPYQHAMALSGGDVEAQIRSVVSLDALGATIPAETVRKRLHRSGIRGIPRGPNAATRANSAGLTTRHREVLELIADGRTNAEIATRMFISLKTVEHHVSAILSKLDAANRRDAVRVATERGLLGAGENRS